MRFERVRYVGVFLLVLGMGFWPVNASGWEGRLADGTRLTRMKLDEMLAAHQKWFETTYKKN